MTYTVVALHRGSRTWATHLFGATRATLRARRLGSVPVRFTDLIPATIDGPIAAVYLASKRAARDPSLASDVEALEALGAPVVPVTREGQTFSSTWILRIYPVRETTEESRAQLRVVWAAKTANSSGLQVACANPLLG